MKLDDNVQTDRIALSPGFHPMPAESDNPVLPDARTQDEELISSGMYKSEVSRDRSLMDRVRNGEQQAMTEIFDRYARLVYSVALRVLNDSGHAEDVMQEIFFYLWRNPDSFSSSRGSLAAWLLVVARNRAIDTLRQRKPGEPVDEVIVTSATNLESEAQRSIMLQKVQVIIDNLPKEQQQSLQMAFFDGLSHSEIAEKTGQPLGTVKTRIRSALSSLRKRLEA